MHQQLIQQLSAEVEDFRGFGHRFVAGEISAPEFKARSGGMGVYAQRGGQAFMLRLRTPSGLLSLEHLKFITASARRCGLDRIHLTTRQAVQLHDLSIDQVCDVMAQALAHGLYTRGGGGNFPRNVSLSPLSGVEQGEVFDVTPFALATGEYLLERITGYHLPRKLKIAFSNSPADSANATLNDLGFVASVDRGTPVFRLYLAGGMGAAPALAIPYPQPVDPREILLHVEAMTRLFMAEGDYEHKGRARTRYIPRRMGAQSFLDCYQSHFDRVKAQLSPLALLPTLSDTPDWAPAAVPGLVPQRQPGRYAVEVHPLCGQLPLDLLERLGAFCEAHPGLELRLSMEEGLWVRGLEEASARELLALAGGALSPVERSVSCIGTPTCQMGIQQSQQLLHGVLAALEQAGAPLGQLPALHISGCGNSCSRHQVNTLGFAGKKVRVGQELVDAFEVHAGGRFGCQDPCLGQVLGVMTLENIAAFLCRLAPLLEQSGMELPAWMAAHPQEFSVLVGEYLV